MEQRFVIRPERSWGSDIAALGPVRHSNFRKLSLSRPLVRAHVRRTCRDWTPDAVMAWMRGAVAALPATHDGPLICRLGDYPLEAAHFAACDLVVGNAPGITARMAELGWQGGLAVVSNFPTPVVPRPVSRSDHDTPDDVPLLATGGRFVHRKGMDIALRAAARIPGLWLWLIGDGKERPALEALARELGIAERTRFIGWVPEMTHHIAAADLFLLPSRHEPLGNVLLEAWQAGVPSISTRCEGPSWFMRDGVDGLMVGIDDVDGTAAALQGLLDDPATAARMARTATERLATMFGEDAVVDAYLRLFALTPQEARAHPMTLRAFLINLDGSDARLRTAATQLDALDLDWTRVSAVDGRGQPAGDFAPYDDAACRRYMGRSMTGAEVACHLSHARAAQAFLDSDASHGLILEDDFTLIADATTLRHACDWLASDAAPDWQIANLGAHKNKISTRIASVDGHDVLRAHYFPMLATAILWTRLAAETFVADAARLIRPADNQLRHWQTRTNGGLSLWPPLFRAGDHPSDIDSRSRRTDKSERTAIYGLAKQRRLWADKIIAMRHKLGG